MDEYARAAGPDREFRDTGPGDPSEPLNFSLLGPLEVRRAGRDITPRAPMQARLLSLLLLHANRVVPFRSAINELWEWPPKLARKTIQTYVYQLRTALGPINEVTGSPLIETVPGGYCIRIADRQLDLRRFGRLVAEGLCARDVGENLRAAAVFREALDLWRGAPLGNIEFGPGVSAQLGLLEEQRTTILEERMGIDLRLGRHRELVGELKALARQHPTHEGFCALLMEAGRRTDNPGLALEAYHELRRNLVGQLGLEPSRRLQQLQQDILNCVPVETGRRPAPAAAQPAVAPSELPSGIADFTGRREALGHLESILGAPAAGWAARTVVIVGQPGIGKSVLAVQAAHVLKERFPDGQLFMALHDRLGGPIGPEDAITRMLGSLGHAPSDLPADPHERATLLRTTTAGRKLLIVLDDVDSADQVLPLVPGNPESAVIVTARNRPIGLSAHSTVELGPLTEQESVELLAGIVGTGRITAEPADSARLVGLCDRLPLAIRIVGEKLLARRAWRVRKLVQRLSEEHRVHEELRVGPFDLGARLDHAAGRLRPEHRDALISLCRLGDGGFDLEAAARTLGMDLLDVEEPVGALVAHHLLQVTVDRSSHDARFRFPPLTRLYFEHASVAKPFLHLAG
ncbi:BTAD domain-containing putative transcriptional regulator [Kitasatospora sp. NPDC058032]|uniref:AfsR/SARP family transcriptional regulator n=1 Tax=Kitasatospora sp. NPDC058032 TaxID=3346307 RepID=UPI0036DCA001